MASPNIDKYTLAEPSPLLADTHLGEVIEAYDNKADRSRGCLIAWGLVVLLTVGGGIYLLCNPPQGQGFTATDMLIAAAVVLGEIIVYFILLSSSRRCQRIFVCREGVQWERYGRSSGAVTKFRTVYWEQVNSVVSRKERRYRADNGDNEKANDYKRTLRTLELLDATGNTLLKLTGHYYNESDKAGHFTWIWYAVKAVERQWAAICVPLMVQQVETVNEMVFPLKKGKLLRLTGEGIYCDDRLIARNNIVVNWFNVDETLALRDASQRRNMLQRTLNLKETHVRVSTMPNGCLLLPLIQQLYGVQLSNEQSMFSIN